MRLTDRNQTGNRVEILRSHMRTILFLALASWAGCASDSNELALPDSNDDDAAPTYDFDPTVLLANSYILRDLIRGQVVRPENVALDHFIFDIGVPQLGFTVVAVEEGELTVEAGALDWKGNLLEFPLPLTIHDFQVDPTGAFSFELEGEYVLLAEIIFPLPIEDIRLEGRFREDGSGFDDGAFSGRVDPRTATEMGYNDFCVLMPQVCDGQGRIPLRIENLHGERLGGFSFPPSPWVCAVETKCPELIQPTGEISCAGKRPDPQPNGEAINWSGIVYDFHTEAPIGGATISIPSLGLDTATQPDGSYRLEGIPANARVDMSMVAEGYFDTRHYRTLIGAVDEVKDIPIVAKSTYNLIPCDFGVCPRATDWLAGEVLDCNGDPLEGYGIRFVSHAKEESCEDRAKVNWFKSGFPSSAQCPASDDGLYGILNSTLGKVWVDVLGADGRLIVREGPIELIEETVGLLMIEIH